jgi:hypothetical protein
VKKRRAELHAKAAERADDFFIPTAAASSNSVPDHDRRLTPPEPEVPEPVAEDAEAPRQGMAALLERLESGRR